MSGFMRTTGMLGLSKAELDERCRPSGYVMFLSPPKSNEMSLLWQLLLCLFEKKMLPMWHGSHLGSSAVQHLRPQEIQC